MTKRISLLFLPVLSVLIFSGCSRKFAPLLQKAETSFSKKDYIGTIDFLNLALPLWKESNGTDTKARAFELLGKSYHQLRNTDKAIESYQLALNLSKKTYDAATALGILYLAKSQPFKAAEAFEKALQMKPSGPQALLGMANSYYAQKRYEEAKIYYNKVLDVSPGVRDALENLQALKNVKSHPVRKASPKAPARKKR